MTTQALLEPSSLRIHSVTPPELPNHELGELLEQGSCARIWRGRHLLLGHDVAIKIPFSRPWDRPTERKSAFLSEAGLARTINHDRIIRVFDVGLTHQQDPYFSMELATRSLNRHLPLPDIFDAIVGVATALAYLHANGIVHCDVKPENVLDVGSSDQPRWVLSDLGLAWTKCRPVIVGAGTYGYVPPERFSSSPPLPESDWYSFARLAQGLLIPRLDDEEARRLGGLLQSSLSADPHDRRTTPLDLAGLIFEVFAEKIDGC